jgi:hypothetical protein
MKCSKCQGEMKEGIIKGDNAYSGAQKWGKEISSWMGTVKDGKDIVTYRCDKCGYLESYAK